MNPSKLWNRNFSILWVGLLQSYLGDAFLNIGIMWLILELTGSAVIASTLIILENTPKVFGPLAGVVVDRTDKRNLLIFSDLIRGAVLLALFLLYLFHMLAVWEVYVGVAILGLFAVFYGPALQVALPRLVPPSSLTQANSLVQGGQQLAMIVGASLAGVILAAFGSDIALLVDGISFIVCGLMLFAIRFPKEPEEGGMNVDEVLHDLKEGLRYFGRAKEVLLITAIAFVINAVLGPVNVVFPIFAKEVLGGGVEAFGFLASAVGVGMLLGNVAVGSIGDRISYVQSIAVGLVMMFLMLVALGMSRSVAMALAATSVLGFAVPFIQVALVSRLQRSVPQKIQGRVFATLGSVVALALPISAAVAGQMLEKFSVTIFFYASAVGVLAVAAVWMIQYGALQRSAAQVE